jgi:hypothetical protein
MRLDFTPLVLNREADIAHRIQFRKDEPGKRNLDVGHTELLAVTYV